MTLIERRHFSVTPAIFKSHFNEAYVIKVYSRRGSRSFGERGTVAGGELPKAASIEPRGGWVLDLRRHPHWEGAVPRKFLQFLIENGAFW